MTPCNNGYDRQVFDIVASTGEFAASLHASQVILPEDAEIACKYGFGATPSKALVDLLKQSTVLKRKYADMSAGDKSDLCQHMDYLVTPSTL